MTARTVLPALALASSASSVAQAKPASRSIGIRVESAEITFRWLFDVHLSLQRVSLVCCASEKLFLVSIWFCNALVCFVLPTCSRTCLHAFTPVWSDARASATRKARPVLDQKTLLSRFLLPNPPPTPRVPACFPIILRPSCPQRLQTWFLTIVPRIRTLFGSARQGVLATPRPDPGVPLPSHTPPSKKLFLGIL